MEKIKINNQVVLMRKHVKQAKVHAINKLVKEVKLLQNRKGNGEQVAKAKRKAERLLQEISILKKSKPDYVSKLALSKARDWKDVLQQKTSTLEDRSIAMLAKYDAVQKEVEKFYCTNPHLISKIPDFIKEWEEKNKLLKESPNLFEKRKKKLNVNMRDNKKNLLSTLTNFDKEDSPLNMQSYQVNSYNEDCELSFDTKKVEDISDNKEYETNKTGMNKHPNKPKEKYKSHIIKDAEILSQRFESFKANNLSTGVLCSINDPSRDLYIEQNTGTEENELVAAGTDNSGDNSDNSAEVEKIKKDMLDSNCGISKRKLSKDVDVEKNKSEASNSSDDDSNNSGEDEKNEKILSDLFNSEITQEKLKKKEISENKPIYITNSRNDEKTLNQIHLNQFVLSSKSFSTENNLKTITVLNLNDLQGLDEIPIVDITEPKTDIDEEKGSEKEIYDPFFLGRDEVNSAGENMVGGNFSNMRSHLKHNDRPRKRDRVEENEVFNVCYAGKRDFQKHLNNFQLSGEKSYKFNEKNKFNTKRNFKKNYSQQDMQDRFHDRQKKKFLLKDPRDFNRKEKRYFLAHGKESSKSHYTNKAISSFQKDKLQNEKANATNGKLLHPSWEAKKKMKELAQKPYQGKRLIFDD